ncbi:MAG: amidohydrolase family protein [Candidatus Heimdallarchaeota archaeon]|nr:amidohydrolase family protein [Candidatus Heimdallarchaeota archaeon]MCK4771088.1 amidohydrolase family protein [Candidatus Heimdallarchaeota archaeon]
MIEYATKNMDSFFSTMPAKYQGPKFDAHVHLGKEKDIKVMLKYTEKFNVKRLMGIVRTTESRDAISKKFPDIFNFALFVSIREALEGDVKKSIQLLDEAYEKGFKLGKLWFSPRWIDYADETWKIDFRPNDLHLNDPNLEPIFSRLEDYGFILLLHVGDPDLMYQRRYQPTSKYGTKESHLKALENLLSTYPKLRVIGAHMAGQPENLEKLSEWMKKYPNLIVDTASARWMAREFGHQIERTKDFFERFSERILFGSDFVTGRTDREPLPGYYIHRYLSYQALLESDIRNLKLPLDDLDNENGTMINGLDLSEKILKKIYWENSKKLFNSA